MTTQTETHTQIAVEVAGLKVNALQDGSGPNIVVFHHSTGSPGWIPFYDLLAENYTVTAIDMPGYGQSERPVWARHPRDIAMMLHSAVHKMGIDNDAHMVGMGFGGWVAAELAAMHLHGLDSLILVGAAGVQPEEGEIADVIFYEFE
ncbi:MAG: alpha/beta hydrolase, partial [Chloroflexi bacterium]|nr:alpha/beta hydrolase [Chloroflexota bacterium]